MFQFNDSFFEYRQKEIVWLANHGFGWLFGLNRLPKGTKKMEISAVTPNSVHFGTGHEKKALFFTRNRFAEALEWNLSPFAYFQNPLPRLSPVGAITFAMLLLFPKGAPLFLGTTDTFYPDPNKSDSVDGYINSPNDTWANARAASVGASATTTNTEIDAYSRYRAGDGLYTIVRGFMLFNTASLPDAATITAVNMGLYLQAGNVFDGDNDGDDFICIVTSSPASNTALVTDDFDQVGSTEQHASGQRKDLTSISTNAYSVFAFDSTGIGNVSKTGVSKFATREGHDLNNNAVTAGTDYTGLIWDSSRQTGTSQDPYLEVTYNTGGTVTIAPPNLLLMGIG